MRPKLAKALISLWLTAAALARAQNPPEMTELSSPEGGTGFGWGFGSLPDLTRDGVGEFYVQETRRVYVYDGAKLQPIYWLDGCDIGISAHSAGDLNGDGIPDLMLGQRCAGGFGQVIVVDGATGAELLTLDSPDPVQLGFFGTTLRLLPDMTGDGKGDWLVHQPEFQSQTGRVYLFDSQTHEVIRTVRNTEAAYRFHIAEVDAIPDVDGDGQPELLVGKWGTSVRRDGRTFNNAGRAIVRSLRTGEVLFELHDPEPKAEGGFGLAVRGIGDVTGDGVSDIAVGTHFKDNNTGAAYVFSGKDGRWLRTLRAPKPKSGGLFARSLEAIPDINDDGAPELFISEDKFKLTYVFDGATGALLTTIEYPGVFQTLFFTGTVRQQAAPGIRAYLFASQFVDGNSGRVYYLPYTPIPKPARLKSGGLHGGGFRLQVTGESGHKLEVQATGDFKRWEPVSSITVGDQAVELEDLTAAGQAQRFYRAVPRQ